MLIELFRPKLVCWFPKFGALNDKYSIWLTR